MYAYNTRLVNKKVSTSEFIVSEKLSFRVEKTGYWTVKTNR